MIVKKPSVIYEEKTKEITKTRVRGFISKHNFELIYTNFSFDFLGLDSIDFQSHLPNEIIK